jgi:hypothetical protein
MVRLLVGAGLFALGYYLGREVGRHEPILEELEQARRRRAQEEDPGGPSGARPPGPRDEVAG